jgi:hypothetical protein
LRDVAVSQAVVQYRCRKCGVTAGNRGNVQEHVAQIHSAEEAVDIEQFYKVRYETDVDSNNISF